MLKTLKNLALALINATLLLIALCLFLAWQISIKADDIAKSFASSLSVVKPLKDKLDATQQELAGLRSDLAEIKSGTADQANAAMLRVETRVDALNERMSNINSQLAKIKEPEQLIDYAIDAAATEVKTSIADFRGCTPSD